MDLFKKALSWNREKNPQQRKSRLSLFSNSKKLQQQFNTQQQQQQQHMQEESGNFLPQLIISSTNGSTQEQFMSSAISSSIIMQPSCSTNQLSASAARSTHFDTKSDASFNTITTTTNDSIRSMHSTLSPSVNTSTTTSVLMIDPPPRRQSKQICYQNQEPQPRQQSNQSSDQISTSSSHQSRRRQLRSDHHPVGEFNETDIESIEDNYVQLGMKYHEKGDLAKATQYWRLASETGSSLGLFFYGIALRHGWGCRTDPVLAVQYLQQAAEFAVYDLQVAINTNSFSEADQQPSQKQQQHQKQQLPALQPTRSTLSSLSSSSSRSTRRTASPAVAKSELILAIYELGVCFRHGWGVPRNLETAACYFQIAANLGDPDAQNDLGSCYYTGTGVKKDNYCAAKYLRLAEKQGQGMIGNSWIWKDKYDIVDDPEWKPGMTIKDMKKLAKTKAKA